MGSKSRLLPSDITKLIRLKTDAAMNSNDTKTQIPVTERYSIVSKIPRPVTSGQYGLITQLFGKIPIPFPTIGDLTNIGAWYDASYPNAVSGSGTSAFSWIDRSGLTVSALNNGTGNTTPYPSLKPNAVNGLNAVTEYAGHTGIKLNSGASTQCGYTSDGKLTFFFVANTPTGHAGFIDYNTYHNFAFEWTITPPSSTTITTHLLDTNDADGTTNISSLPYNTLNNPFMACVTVETRNTVDGATVFFNGTSIGKVKVGNRDLTFLQPVLNRNGTTMNDQDFCEIILFKELLSTSRRQQVEGYLAWKWGLQKSLPSDHPYYTLQ